jgi:PKD repeat protein
MVAAMTPRTHRHRQLPETCEARRPRRTAAALVLAALSVGALILAPVGPAAAAGVPNAPSGLAAQIASGQAMVALVWADNSSDETGFEIERCTKSSAGCAFAPLASTPANTPGYADFTTISAYRYRVRAVNAAGASAWSAETALPSGIGFGGYPTAVMTASPTSGNAPLTVTFDGSQSTVVDSVIASYSWSFGDGATATGVTATHTYPAAGTYRATLTVSSVGDLANLTSTSITVTTPAPGVPANLTGSSTVKRRIDLRWSNPAGTNATVLWVNRCAGATCAVFSRVATLPATVSSWSDTTVRSGSTYRYMVIASNGVQATSSNVATVKAR